MDEMKWLQQDFSEERRLKIAACFELSQAVMDYWAFGKDVCCIRTRPVTHLDDKPPIKLFEVDSDGDAVMEEDSRADCKGKVKDEEEPKKTKSKRMKPKRNPNLSRTRTRPTRH